MRLPTRTRDTVVAPDAGRTILVVHGRAWVHPGWFFWIIVKALGVLDIEVSRPFSFIAVSAISPARSLRLTSVPVPPWRSAAAC